MMPEDPTFQLLALLGAAFAGFCLGVWMWRALTLRDRREAEQRHANEVKDLRDRWQQAQREADKPKQQSKGSEVRSKPAQAALVKPKAASEPDDLQRIKGVGKALERRLRELDVRTFAQIAAWTDADVERIEAGLNSIPGRIERDRWVEQAKKLAE